MQISPSRAKNETARREERAESKQFVDLSNRDNIAQVVSESERAVLGCLIENPGLLPRVLAAHLSSDDFLLSDHARAFNAIIALHAKGAPVDYLSVADELGGDQTAFAFIAHVTEGVVVEPKHAAYHARKIKSNARARELLKLAEWIPQGLAEMRDPDLLIAQIREKLNACSEGEIRS